MYQTREEWLTQAIDLLRPEFVLAGAPLPASIRVACAETPNFSRHGLEVVALSDSQSSDRAVEITVSWTLDDPSVVLARLVHGLCAATAGASKHGPAFVRIATDMGLIADGKTANPWTRTKAGPSFRPDGLMAELGLYPHAKVNPYLKAKQGTRMLLAKCPKCNYAVRLTQKWVYAADGSVNLPICPNDRSIFQLA